MNKLKIENQGITYINPFLLASSPITRTAEMIKRGFEAGWGGAVLKTICLCPETIIDVSRRIYVCKNNSSFIGLKNIEMISNRPVELWAKEINELKTEFPDRVIIASIMAEGEKLQEWRELTEILQDAGADAIELNLSCPNGVPERGMGSYISEIPDMCGKITTAVKKVSKVPVWAKLSPNVTDISHLAFSCLQAGADGITAINTLKGFAGIDIESLQPKLNVGGFSAYGGFSGHIAKPFALKAVSEIAKQHSCHISAAGGISNWIDAVEFMLLGASTLQICSEVMLKGYNIINPLINGLESYLERHSYASLKHLTGAGLEKINDYGKLDKNIKYTASINKNYCLKCGKCFVSCMDGGYQAINKESDYENMQNKTVKATYSVNHSKCVGCGLCQYVCPVNAISMTNTAEKSLLYTVCKKVNDK